MINPFNVTFGKTPLSGIDRSQERKLVEDTFQEENPSSQTFILTEDIRESLKMNNGNLQTYKKRLIDKGIIFSSSRGEIGFALPRFKEFVKTQEMLED